MNQAEAIRTIGKTVYFLDGDERKILSSTLYGVDFSGGDEVCFVSMGEIRLEYDIIEVFTTKEAATVHLQKQIKGKAFELFDKHITSALDEIEALAECVAAVTDLRDRARAEIIEATYRLLQESPEARL